MPQPTKPIVVDAWANAAGSSDLMSPPQSMIDGGWPLSSTPPARQYFNWILNFCANGVRYLSRRGLSDYDPAETYMSGDVVISDDGLVRASLKDNNSGNTPSTSPTWWGSVKTLTPAPGDNSNSIATTSYVVTNFAPLGSSVSSLSGQVSPSQVPQAAVTQYQGALLIGWNQITGVKNADELQGYVPSVGAAGSTIPLRTPEGYINCTYLNSSAGAQDNLALSYVGYQTGDGYLRWRSWGNFVQSLLWNAALGGTPTCPTAPASTNSAQVASCSYVINTFFNNPYISGATCATPPDGDNTGRVPNTYWVNLRIGEYLNSPNFPTRPPGSNDAYPASTAFVYQACHPGGSYAQNGWTELPNGVIIQWGLTGVVANGTYTIGFPRAFPSFCAIVLTDTLAPSGIGGAGGWEQYLTGWNQSEFFLLSTGVTSGGVQVPWVAFGW
jgi:hypothetical protein